MFHKKYAKRPAMDMQAIAFCVSKVPLEYIQPTRFT